MSEPHARMTLRRTEPEQLTLESLAACAGVHPALITYFVEYGLLEPSARTGTQWLFDTACIARLRMIERLRRDLGANLAGIAVILDLLDRLTTLQREVEQWRRRS
jgi:MerR family transcriptional regulator, heat shock protein HspR